MHIDLRIWTEDDSDRFEPVHVESTGDSKYRILYSPGFVPGIAAGDEIELIDDHGRFEVLSRGGNVAVQVFSDRPIRSAIAQVENDVMKLGGRLDGAIERGAVFTIPVESGFSAIEDAFDRLVESAPGVKWMYGNVYDPEDGVTPLGWWE